MTSRAQLSSRPYAPAAGFASGGLRLGRYIRTAWPWYVRLPAYLALATFALFYGFAFAVMSQVTVAPLFLPLLIVAFVALWVMPDVRYPPVRALAVCLTAVAVGLMIWPDYLAIQIGALPWISFLRLTAIPTSMFLLIAAFGSKLFRRQMTDILRGNAATAWLLVAFWVTAALSIAFSADKAGSISKIVIISYAWVGVFFASVYCFNKPGRVERFAWVMVAATVISLFNGLYESVFAHLPWRDHIPAIFKIEDPSVLKLLAGSARAASGKYRVQSKFSTSIGLGEFFGLTMPFILHLIFVGRNWIARAFLLALLPIICFVVIETDSRLAFICFCTTLMLYPLYAGVMTWQRLRTSLFAPAVVVAYPIMIAGFMVLSLIWHKLGIMIWGGGAQQFSTQSRHEQVAKGMPMILHNPFGYGIGQGAVKLNYFAPGSDTVTIDSYYLCIGLEVGVVGFLCFFGLFAITILYSGYGALKTKDRETMFLGACCVSLVNFLLGKSVYAQIENHPLAFIVLGMTVALLRRYRTEAGQLPPPPDPKLLIESEDRDLAKDWERRPELAR